MKWRGVTDGKGYNGKGSDKTIGLFAPTKLKGPT